MGTIVVPKRRFQLEVSPFVASRHGPQVQMVPLSHCRQQATVRRELDFTHIPPIRRQREPLLASVCVPDMDWTRSGTSQGLDDGHQDLSIR